MLKSALNVAIRPSASATVSSRSCRADTLVDVAHQRHLEPGADAAQGRAQVVRDVVGDLPHAGHQPLDPRQHGVQIGGQRVELVARALDQDSPAEIACHDLRRRAVDRLDAAEHPAAHDEAADHAEDQHQQAAEPDGVDQQRLGAQLVLDVAGDEQPRIVEQYLAAEKAPRPEPVAGIEREAHPIAHRVVGLRPLADIAGDDPTRIIDQQVDAAELRPRPRHVAR